MSRLTCRLQQQSSLSKVILPVLMAMLTYVNLSAQTVLLSNPGTTYNDTDGPTNDLYGPVNVSNCSSVRFEMTYSFSLAWSGSGNMESSDECAFTVPPCPGNPATPLATGCPNCWDFLWARFMIDGAEVGGDLIGEAGTTDAEQSGVITLDYCTMGMATTAQINVSTQTWAADEAVTFSNIMIICYEGVPTATANPNPICSDEILNLNANVLDPGVVTSSNWTGPGNINDPFNLNTQVTDIPPGPANYVITTTDVNGCMSSDNVMVTVHPSPMAFDAGPLEACDDGTGQAMFDLTQLNTTITGGMAGNVLWYRDIGLSNQINTPSLFTSGPTTVYAVIDNGFCTSEIIEVELIVLPQPRAFTAMMTQCEQIPGSGVATFNLALLNNQVNGGSGDMVTYYQDPGGTTPVPIPFTTTSTTVYAKVSNGVCESMLVQIQLIVQPSPGGSPVNIEVCEDAAGLGSAQIDLGSYKNDITMAPGVTITFYEDDQFVVIADDPYTAGIGTTTLYAKVNNGACDSQPISITITVYEVPGAREAILEVCEDPPGSGLGYFELDSFYTFVVGAQLGLTIEWYSDPAGTIMFPNPYNGGDTTIYARASNGACESELVQIELKTIEKPTAYTISDTACADQSGTAFFDLSLYEDLVSIDTSAEEVFFAADSLFTIPVNTNFRTSDTTIFARVKRGTCFSDVVRIRLVAIPGPILSGLNDVTACDSFSLSNIPGMNLTGSEAYYLERNGRGTAFFEGDILRQSGTIYYYDGAEKCFDQDSFVLTIVASPEGGLDNTVTICEGSVVDLTTYLIGADQGGLFVDLDGSGALSGTDFNSAGLNGQSFTFRYLVNGTAPCGPDSSELTINVQQVVTAGQDSIVVICQGDSIDLTDFISGDVGGQFTDVNGSGGLNGNRFNSIQSGVGTFDFTYKVGDGVVCPEDEATITVQVDAAIVINSMQDITACDFYILEGITGINTQFASYYTGPSGSGNILSEGDTIRSTTVLYAFGQEAGYCEDEISFTITIFNTAYTDIRDSLCFGESLRVGNNVFDSNNPRGMVTITAGAENGCDSIISVDLFFHPEISFDLNRTLCRGQFVVVNGITYDQGNPSGREVLTNASQEGCDSTVNINLSFEDYAVGQFSRTICKGDTLFVNGSPYYEANPTGMDTLLGQGAGGCDSIVEISIDFYHASTTLDSTLCTGEFITINGNIYDENNPQGTEMLIGMGQFGCDSIIEINLNFESTSTFSIVRTLCFGDSIIVNNNVYNESNPIGNEVIVGGAVNGCDSIIDINLDFQRTANEVIARDICSSDTLIINGRSYYAGNSSGSDTLFGQSQSGCDSVIMVDLNVLEDVESQLDLLLCPEDEIVINGVKYNADNPFGTEVFPGGSSNGCDSIVYINLDFEQFSLNPQQSIIQLELGDSVRVDLAPNFNYDSVFWSPSEGLSCTDCINPIIKTGQSTVYTVTVVTSTGCIISTTIEVIVDLNTNVFVPNSYTPNGDNLNDVFKLYVKEGKVETVDIFNIYSRWGELIYSELGTNPDNGSHIGWNGTFNGQRMNPGVYVYQIELTLIGGRSMKLHGSVTLVE